jgi:hypothetical protein
MESILVRIFAFVAIAVLFSSAHADDLWYMGHVGAEPCVPLQDIASDFSRVYYGAGVMRVPEDIANAFRRMGAVVVNDKPGSQHGAFYHATFPDGQRTNIVMFQGEELCRSVLSTVKP